MKCLIVLSALVAFSSAGLAPLTYSALPYAGYAGYPYGLSGLGYSAYSSPIIGSPYVSSPITTYAAAPAIAAPVVTRTITAPAVIAAPATVKTQYHAQDELGQASYGHSEPLQSHSAVQDAHGNKVGSFSYVAPDGRVLRTDYVADALGYRVESNALPVGPGAGPLPVVDTPEVVAARAAHLATHVRARRSLVAVGHTPASTAPLAVAPALAYAAAPVPAYSAVYPSALSYSTFGTHLGAPLATSYAAPLATSYAAPLAAPLAIAPTVREATLTTVVNNPGHAVSYRVD